MSNVMNFTGVEESAGSKYLVPGVHEVKITKTEFGESTTKQTPFMKVFFEDGDGATMNESFYMSQGALPRIQHLVSNFTTSKLTGDVTSASLNALLVGKRARLLVDGEKTFNKDGKVVTYTRLRFGGFAQPLNDNRKFNESLVKIEDKTVGIHAPVASLPTVDDAYDMPF